MHLNVNWMKSGSYNMINGEILVGSKAGWRSGISESHFELTY